MYLKFHSAERKDTILRWYYPDWRYQGTMLDIGCGDPIFINSSYHFEQNGWRVICIDANPHYAELAAMLRQRVIHTAVGAANEDDAPFTIFRWNEQPEWMMSGSTLGKLTQNGDLVPKGYSYGHISVQVRTLDWILENEQPPLEKVDIVAIDIEGGEAECLKGFDLARWDPDVVLVSCHSAEQHRGCRQLMQQAGYMVDRSFGSHDLYFVKSQPTVRAVETLAAQKVMQNRWFHYERKGLETRRLEFLEDRRIGEGNAACERHWEIETINGKAVLEIQGDIGVICRLEEEANGSWQGQWTCYERVPVRLTPAHSSTSIIEIKPQATAQDDAATGDQHNSTQRMTEQDWQNAPAFGRRDTLLKALRRLQEIHPEPACIVETGTIREDNAHGLSGDGWSTVAWGWYSTKTGGRAYTVDISPENIAVCRKVTAAYAEHLEYVVCDSHEFLRQWNTEERGKINFLYLDSLDYHDRALSESHCLTEAQIALPLLAESCLILFDDTSPFGPLVAGNLPPFTGKGAQAIPFLVMQGFRIEFAEYGQTLLVRDPGYANHG